MNSMTSTYQPTPSFFRRKQPRKLSISSSYSNDSSDDSDSEDDSSSSSSQSSSSSLSARSFSAFRSNNNNNNSLSINNNSIPTSTPVSLPDSSTKRVHFRTSLAIIQIRSALYSSSWDQLSNALKSLCSILPSDLSTLGIFIPIIARIEDDLRLVLAEEVDKMYKKNLSKADAKGLIFLKQRYMKGKGKETEGVAALVSLRETPSFLARPHSRATSALLSGLESILLPTALPKLVLSDLGLESLSNWEPFERCEEVLNYYLSFDSRRPREGKAKAILAGIKSLNLEKNRLNDLPMFLPLLFPSLETLSLSHNQFKKLPTIITLFPHLQQFKTHRNLLSKSRGGHQQNTKLMASIIKTRSLQDVNSTTAGERVGKVESLVNITTKLLKQRWVMNNSVSLEGELNSSQVDEEEDLNSKLPLHLQTLISKSYYCASCQLFISPFSDSYLPPLYEKVSHLNPGVSIPTYPVPPSSTSPSPPQSPVRVLSLEEKVFISLLVRGADLSTYVMGSESYSFCVECCSRHLGLVQEGNCVCHVCEEERKVRVKAYGADVPMRWLRRRLGTKI